MRDRVELNATLYHPLNNGDRYPTVFIFTPYVADTYHERGRYFAQHGFAVAIVDVRGRGSSGGTFEPHADLRTDGHDVVQWLAAQPHSDGNVVMWGGSYGATAQWHTASQKPPNLRTIVPAAPAIIGQTMPFQGGVFIAYNLQWLTLVSGKIVQWNSFSDAELWYQAFKRMYLEHRSFAELDVAGGNTSTEYREWTKHQCLDEYWDRFHLNEREFAAIDLPVLSISGLYDDVLIGTIGHYRQHLAAVGADVAAKHYFVIGPWDHLGTRSPQRSVGGLRFGRQALLDVGALHLGWYRWAIGAGPFPDFLKDRVAYYVSGVEEWRYAPTLDAITTSRRRFFLESRDGRAHDVFASGLLSEESSGSAPATFTYDPLDTRPAEVLKPIDCNRPLTLFDQTTAFNLFGNGLVYHSEPFPQDIVLAGSPIVHVWISIDVPDTDFRVGLYQILPDGTSLILGEDFMRARYRASLRAADFPEPGRPYEYRFERLTWNSRLLVKHSRIRLVVSCPNSMFEQKNYNSGGDVMRETAADARTAHVTVHHREPHASYIELPLGDVVAKRRLEPHEAGGLFLEDSEAERTSA